MSYKALAIDLDGTLLIGESLPPGHRDAVRRAADAGYSIIIATARWRQMAERVADEIGITGPIIACSGAEVWLRQEDRDIFDHRLPDDFTREAFEYFDNNRCIVTTTGDSETLLALEGEPDASLLSPEMRWVTSLTSESISPRIATVQGSAVVNWVKETLRPKYQDRVNIYDSIGPNGKIVLTLTHRSANKGHALRAACEHLGIEPASVVAFGDAENDISMFAVAGASVGMGQAPIEVRQAATTVTAANTENGVGIAIDRLLETGSVSQD